MLDLVKRHLTFIIEVMEDLKSYIAKHKVNKEKADDFVIYLSNLIKERGYSKDSQVYNKANISRQTWSSIMSGKHIPSLNNLIKIVIHNHILNLSIIIMSFNINKVKEN